MVKDWDAFGDIETQAQAAKEEMQSEEKERDKLTLRVFSTEDGKKWLDDYLQHTLEKPVMIPELGLWQAIATGFQRGGENKIFHEIKLRMKRAMEEV